MAKKAREGKVCFAFNKGQCTRAKPVITSIDVSAGSTGTVNNTARKIENEKEGQGKCPQPGRAKNARQLGAARTAHGAGWVTPLALLVEGRALRENDRQHMAHGARTS